MSEATAYLYATEIRKSRAANKASSAPLGDPIVKSIDAQRFVLGVAHPAGWSDLIVKGQDGHRDYMSAEEVEKAAWGHVAEGREIGLRHIDGTVGAATVVESYVYRGPDWIVKDTIGNEQLIKQGDWLVGAVLEPDVWEQYQAGWFTGWSVQGVGRRLVKTREGQS